MRFVPGLFVLIWATGFVVARYAAPHAEPLTFLLIRYIGVVLVMGLLAAVFRAPWPASRRDTLHIAVAGVGIQAGYLGGVWVAVGLGMPAGIAALITNLQPVLTAIAAPLIGERVDGRQWLGLGLGFAGVGLVVSATLTTGGLGWSPIALALLALVTITCGTLYQKRFCPDFDLRTGQVIQFTASIVVTAPFALAFESFRVDWNVEFFAALAWSVLVLTSGGISLLFLMIRRGSATQVTSYFYLVPSVTAVLAFAMFDERLHPVMLVGMAVTVVGVWVGLPRPRLGAAASSSR